MNNILYVDDEPINLILFNAVFKSTFIVHTASSGEDGINILKENAQIRAVVSDMKMPGMNGLEFIQKARKLFPMIKYFILTGYDVTPEIQDSLNNGLICKCFQKPMDVMEITCSISEV